MTDLLAKLDALDPHWGCIEVEMADYLALRAELLAAREVCEAVDVAGYLKHGGPLADKWLAWRAARAEAKHGGGT